MSDISKEQDELLTNTLREVLNKESERIRRSGVDKTKYKDKVSDVNSKDRQTV